MRPAAEDVLVETRALQLGFDRRRPLARVDMAIAAGQWWCVLGPNGCGKTTLLRTLLGVQRPLGGELLRAPGTAPGYVPQACTFAATLPTTLAEYVGLGLAGSGLRGAAARDAVGAAIAAVDLGGHERSPYQRLSGGQRQRAMLARALAGRPVLLLLDEPTSALDQASEDALTATLARLQRERGIALALVTHDLVLAARTATHVVLFLPDGVIAGPRAAVLTAERIAASYRLPDAVCAGIAATARAETP